MASTIKIKAKLSGDEVDVKSLMLHPMETGARKDPDTGQVLPVHHITQLVFTNNGTEVMVANFSTAVSKDPYFAFRYRGAKAGDTLNATWTDNTGATDSLDVVLK
jgi:sulfur-oxidizing protein SoxZ